MKKILFISFLVLLCLCGLTQAPAPSGLPAPYSTAYYRIGFMYTDSGLITASRDTSIRSRYAGLMFLWQHAGLDSSQWFYNGSKYIKTLNAQDTLPGRFLVTKSFLNNQGYLNNITGYLQQGTNVTITGSGTIGSPYVINSTGGGGADSAVNPGLWLSQTIVGTTKTLNADSALMAAYFLRRSDSIIDYVTPTQLANSTPTFEKVLVAGSTLLTDHFVDATNHQFNFDSTSFFGLTSKVNTGNQGTFAFQPNQNVLRTIGGSGTTVSEVATFSDNAFGDGTTNGINLRADNGIVASRLNLSERYIHLISDSIKLGGWGTGTHLGTVAFKLGIDALGNILEDTSSGSTPGIDNVLAVNQNLTANRSINANNHDFTLINAATFSLNSISTTGDTSGIFSANAATAQMVASMSDLTNSSSVYIRPESVQIISPLIALNTPSVILSTYGTGTHLGLRAYPLAVTATGDIIEDTTSSGGGGGGGISTLNTLTAATQTFATGTSGSDFGIVSSGSTHTFNIPDGSGSSRGLLTIANFNTFNGKLSDPLTTNGDIIARISGSTTRLAQGSNGTFLGVSGGVLGYYTPSGGGTIGGSIASGQVGYGTATNTLGSEAAFTYDATANKVSTDSLGIKSINGDATSFSSVQYPFSYKVNYAGYGGMRLQNTSASGSAVTQLLIVNNAGDLAGGAIELNVLSSNFAGGATVMRMRGPQPFVLANDSNDIIVENGIPGVNAVNRMHIFNSTGRTNFGNDGAYLPWNTAGPRTTIRVLGSGTFTDTLKLCDNTSGGYATILAQQTADSNTFVRNAGLQFMGTNAANLNGFLLAKFDPSGTFTIPLYTNSYSSGGYTTKAWIGTNSAGLLGVQNIFDTASGTRNSGNVMFWNASSVPSSGSLNWDNTNRVLNVASTFGGKIVSDSIRLYKGFLLANDEGHNYAFFRALNFGNGASYVEGVGWRFQTITQANATVDAFRIDSGGIIKIPQPPPTATSADSALFWSSGSSGAIKKMTISALGSLIGSSAAPFSDASALVKNSSDATKLLRFNASNQTTGTTNVVSFPNTTAMTVARTDAAQTFTGDQTFSNDIVLSSPGSSGANDSVLMWNPSTNKVEMKSAVLNLFASNGVNFSGGNTFKWGGALSDAVTNISGAGLQLNIGTSGSHIGQFNLYADTLILNGSIQFSGGNPTNANLTVGNEGVMYLLPAITANRTITLPSAANQPGRIITFPVANTADFNWSFSTTVINPDGSTVTTLLNGFTYTIQSHSTFGWLLISASPSAPNPIESGTGTLTLSTASDYTFTGSTATWTLPLLANNKNKKYYIKNAGSGNLTVQRTGSDNIYDVSSVTSITIAAGAARVVFGGVSFWYVE